MATARSSQAVGRQVAEKQHWKALRGLGCAAAILVCAATAYAQGYNSGGYGATRAPSGGGGSITGGSCGTNQFATAVGPTGVPTCVQPPASAVAGLAPSATTDTTNASNISSGTLGGARLPAPTSSSLGGVLSNNPVAHNWTTYIDTAGVAHQGQPGAGDISGLAASATTDTTNATNITSGTLPWRRLQPAASANLSSQYTANGQPGATFGGALFQGATQVSELTPPTGVACTCSGGSGTTYYYAVSAVEYPPNGTAGGYQSIGYVIQGSAGESAKSGFVSCSGPSSLSYPSNYCTVTWNPWSTVAGYKVWGRTNNAATTLSGVAQNYGTGGITGSSLVDFGILVPQASSIYQSGLFKAEGGIGTGDWAWKGWPGQPGDVYFKELGSSKVNVVLGATADQLSNNASNQMVIGALNGVALNSDSQLLKSGWQRPGLTGNTGPLTSITGPMVLNGTINTDAIYVEHLTAFLSSITCSTNPTFTIYDCGTAASCPSPVAVASVTPTATGLTSGDSGITTHAVAANHYLEIALAAGSCTALNGGATVEWAGN